MIRVLALLAMIGLIACTSAIPQTAAHTNPRQAAYGDDTLCKGGESGDWGVYRVRDESGKELGIELWIIKTQVVERNRKGGDTTIETPICKIGHAQHITADGLTPKES